MKKITYALLASTLMAGTPAFLKAEGNADPKTCANFNGLQLGLLGGYGSGSGNTIQGLTNATGTTPRVNDNAGTQISAAVPNTVSVSTPTAQVAIDGGNVGLGASYGRQLQPNSKLHVAAEVSYTVGNAQGKAAGMKIQIKDSLKAGIKLGSIFGSALLHVDGGVDNTKAEGKYLFANGSVYPFLNDRLTGWYVGFGGDAKISPTTIIGFVYQYSHLPSHGKQSMTTSGPVPVPVTPPGAGNGPYVFAPPGATGTAPTTTAKFKSQINNSSILVKVAFLF